MIRRGPQFHKRTFPPTKSHNEAWSNRGSLIEEYRGGGASTDYTYSPNMLGEVGAELSVSHNPAKSYTRYPPQGMLQPDTEDDQYDVNEWFPAEGQIPLFSHQSNQAYDVVTGLGSTKSSRVPAMTMLGLAANDAQRRGVTLSPSRNLSAHSMGMVQNLANRGAVGADQVPAHTGNTSTFWEEPNTDNPMAWSANHGFDEVGAEEISAGRRTLRSILGRRRQDNDGQGVLFSGPTTYDPTETPY